MLTFQNSLSVPSSWASRYTYPPMKMELTESSELLAYKIKMPGSYREESMQQNVTC